MSYTTAYWCPQCNAPPNAPCRTRTGRILREWEQHEARTFAMSMRWTERPRDAVVASLPAPQRRYTERLLRGGFDAFR